MICGRCRTVMIEGVFKTEGRTDYACAAWYKDDEKYCVSESDTTLGYYCPECGMLIGVFSRTYPVNFIGRYNQKLDDKIDILPKKICPECGTQMDIDYPRCSICGFVFETI